MTDNLLTVRVGTVVAVDAAACRCDVSYDDLEQTTRDMPVLQHGAGGNARAYWLPAVGEPVLCLHMSLAQEFGFVVGSYYSTSAPPPQGDGDARYVIFPDGASVRWQHGALSIVAPGGVSIIGDLAVSKSITAGDDVFAGGISLTGHVHGGVQSGSAMTSPPQ